MKQVSSNWQGRRIFVTGAAGFIGGALTKRLLQEGASVIVLIRDVVPQSLFKLEKLDEKVTVVQGDLADYVLIERILNEYSPEIVFHLGAQALVGVANRFPLDTFSSNIQGTWNILEASRKVGSVKKVVVASSDKAYGEHGNLPYQEDFALQPKHPYDVSKGCADLLAQSYFHTYQLPVCVVRCGNVFGEGDIHFNRLIPGTIRSILHNEQPLIRSNGLFVRDYIYLQDVVAAYLLVAQNMDNKFLHGHAFNFSYEQPMTVIEVVEKLLHLMGSRECGYKILNTASGEIEKQFLSCKKAQELLGWEPSYSFNEGLERTVAWYGTYFNSLQSHSIVKSNPFSSVI